MAEQTIKEGEPKMTLLEELKLLLEKDERLVSEGKLLKNRIVELALKLDKDLIKLLLSNGRIKEHFFKDVDGILVFDKEKFMKFVDNKEFLPDSYTAFKNKIGLTADKNYIAQSKEVVLAWPYKDCILEGGQEESEEKRKEIFHNEILAPDEIDRLLEPKVFTNFKRIDAKGEHKVKEIKPTDNLIIKGNNLLVLHSLKKRFAGKVKLIYIDPPYNTGNDEFKYNDNFNHSTWLTFMKNRLEVARELLRDEGLIFISIDENEQPYLQVLCDELFGRENFIANLVWKKKYTGGKHTKFFVDMHEYILVYAKNKDLIEGFLMERPEQEKEKFQYKDEYFKERGKYYIRPLKSNLALRRTLIYPIKCPDGTEIKTQWVVAKDTFEKLKKEGRILFKKKKDGKYQVYRKYYEKDAEGLVKVPSILEFTSNNEAKLELKKIFNISEGRDNVFYTVKPLRLIKFIIKISTKPNNNDIILDFFPGSGTTAHAVLELNKEDGGNRQFIMCEQMGYIHSLTIERLKRLPELIKEIGFVYMELKELNEQFVQKIKKAKDTRDLLKIWEEMKQHAFLSYRVDPKLFDENIEEFKKLSAEEQKKLLIECLDANNLYVNYSEIEDRQYKISKEDIKLNKIFYRRL